MPGPEKNQNDHLLMSCLFLLVIAVTFASLMLGPAALSIEDGFLGLLGMGDERARLIIQEIRLPRTLTALAVGAALGLSGAALQGLLRNPLADPGVLGVTTTAGLGAVIAIYYGWSVYTPFAIPFAAMISAGLATLILWFFVRKGASLLTIILAGVAINALAGALLSFIMVLAPNPFTLADMIRWLMGSLQNRSYSDLYLAVPFMIPGTVLLFRSAKGLRGLSLGDDVAASLGVNIVKVRGFIIFGSALMIGAGVAVSGAIGFIGLIVPHLLRPFVHYDPGRLLAPSVLAGAAFLTAADISVRLLPFSRELNLGVLTALIGAPFFLWLIFSTRRDFT